MKHETADCRGGKNLQTNQYIVFLDSWDVFLVRNLVTCAGRTRWRSPGASASPRTTPASPLIAEKVLTSEKVSRK